MLHALYVSTENVVLVWISTNTNECKAWATACAEHLYTIDT